MTALTLATVLHASLFAAAAEPTYVEAHRSTVENGKPMLVMVGASWCGPCQTMKNSTLPQVRRNGQRSTIASYDTAV